MSTYKEKILRGFKTTLVAEAVRIGAKGLLFVLLARTFLSPSEYGLLFLAISIFAIALFFSDFGIGNSTARYIAEYNEADTGQLPHLVRVSVRYNLALILVTASVVALFHQPIAAQFDDPALEGLLLVGFFYIVAKTMNSYLYTLFQGFNRVHWSAIVSIAANLGIFVAVIGLLLAGFGVIGALVGYILGYSFGALVGLVLLYRLVSSIEPAPSIESGLSRRLLEYSIPLAATNGSNILYKRVDTVLVGFFLTPVAVGYYVLAKQLSEFVIAPANSLGFAVSPTYGEHKAAGRIDEAARIYEQTFTYNLLFYVPAAAGLVLVAEPTVEFIFGPDYLDAVPVIQILSIFIVLQSIDKITNDALDYLGRAKHRAIAKGSTGVLNVGLNVLLIPTIGVVGAAVSTVVSYTIMVAVNIYLINAELNISFAKLGRSLVVVSGVTVGMSATVALLLPLVTNLSTLLGVVVLGGIVWVLISASTGILDVRQAIAELR